MLSGLLPLLRESPPYARIRGAVQERRPMWVQGPAGAEKAYLLGALLADPEVAVETTVIVLPGRDAAERLGGGLPLFAPALAGRPALSPHLGGGRPPCGRTPPQTRWRSGGRCWSAWWWARRPSPCCRSRVYCAVSPRPSNCGRSGTRSGAGSGWGATPSSPCAPRPVPRG